MAKRRFFTVGFELPSDNFEYINYESKQTLLDADVTLFQPSLSLRYLGLNESYAGKSLFSEHSSFVIHQQIKHWHAEILAAAAAGKLVIVYLTEPRDAYRYTGEASYSGTGRSRAKTNHVTPISSYDAVPFIDSATVKHGTGVKLERDGTFLGTYWQEFGKMSPYLAEIAGTFKQVLLRSQSGDRVVGARMPTATGGNIIYLPPIDYDEDTFLVERTNKAGETAQYWTKTAITFGERLAQILSSVADSLKQDRQVTPPPPWTEQAIFRLENESKIESQIDAVTDTLSQLAAQKSQLELELAKTGELRHLLYEQGHPLEAAILTALSALGFSAAPFKDAESEFDAVFVSPEGRCLGEAEGKDSKSINIDKLAQLERNVQEDFARDDVAEHAKGVLFGNAYRLKPLDERPAYFTEKCVSGARRTKFALVRTPDLFEPARYLLAHPEDVEYARNCRKTIFASEGDVVVFPNVPEAAGSSEQ